MKLLRAILILSSIAFLSACDKNETHCPPPKGQCVYPHDQFLPSAPDTGKLTGCGFDPFEIYVQKYDYDYPCFNPNNPDEFSFVRLTNQAGAKGELFTYNLCSKVLTKLASNVSFYSSWSSKNCIAFTGDDHKLYMVKSNGDSLTKITNLPCAQYNPVWNPNGTKISIRAICNGQVQLIYDLESRVFDTIPYFCIQTEWMNDSTLTTTSGSSSGQLFYFSRYVLPTKSQEEIYSHSSSGQALDRPNSIKILSDKQIISWNSGLNIYNLTFSGTNKLVSQKGSITRIYTNATYSSNNIIVTRYDREDIPPVMWCKWGLKTNLFIMNNDGSDEKQIVFPE